MSEMELTEGQLLSQDFGVGGPPAAVRPLAVIEAELDMLKQDTRQKETALLCNYIEFGRRLEEAKAQLRHGEWGGWLKKRELSQSTANNFMRLYREYGADQQSLFGGVVKSQAFANLTYSQAVLMLTIPEEERERFMEENNVAAMSNRELREAIKARNEAEEKAVAAEDEARRLRQETQRLQEQLTGQAQVYEAKLTSAGVEADQLREKLRGSDLEVVDAKRRAREAREALDKQRDKAQRLQEALSEANTSAQTAEEEHTRLMQELEELRSRPPEADTGAVEAARKAAIEEMTGKVDKAKEAKKQAEEKRKAAEKALEAAQKELADLKAKGPKVRELTQEEKEALTARAVEQARAEDAEQIQNLKKELAQADPDVTTFKVLLDRWQDAYDQMMEVLGRIAQANEERAARLQQAVKAVLEQMA